MSDIANKILAIAEERETEHLKQLKLEEKERLIMLEPCMKKFISYMETRFKEHIECCECWTAIDESCSSEYYYIESVCRKCDCTSSEELEIIVKHLGFNTKRDICNDDKVYISIPKWINGKKATWAQKKFWRTNIEVYKMRSVKKELAQKIFGEALEKLGKGDFISELSEKKCEVTIEVSHKVEDDIIFEELKKLFSEIDIDLYYTTYPKDELRLKIERCSA